MGNSYIRLLIEPHPFLKIEEIDVGIQEFLIKKFPQKFIFDILRKLFHETCIFFVIEHIIFILVPPVIEVGLDFPFDFDVE